MKERGGGEKKGSERRATKGESLTTRHDGDRGYTTTTTQGEGEISDQLADGVYLTKTERDQDQEVCERRKGRAGGVRARCD